MYNSRRLDSRAASRGVAALRTISGESVISRLGPAPFSNQVAGKSIKWVGSPPSSSSAKV
jgi:hypothetical protein